MRLAVPMARARRSPSPPAAPARGGRLTRSAGLCRAGLLAFAILLSLAVGARSIPLGEVVDAPAAGGDSQNAPIVRDLRLPRTLLGLARRRRRSASRAR